MDWNEFGRSLADIAVPLLSLLIPIIGFSLSLAFISYVLKKVIELRPWVNGRRAQSAALTYSDAWPEAETLIITSFGPLPMVLSPADFARPLGDDEWPLTGDLIMRDIPTQDDPSWGW